MFILTESQLEVIKGGCTYIEREARSSTSQPSQARPCFLNRPTNESGSYQQNKSKIHITIIIKYGFPSFGKKLL